MTDSVATLFGKKAIVIGGSRGIGAAIVRRLTLMARPSLSRT
jgi:NAD(P)-dependent dehydrogenase (short-subunit alcohol dehydrogenase family)